MIYDELWTLEQYIINKIKERTNNEFGEHEDYLEKSENIQTYVETAVNNSINQAIHDCDNVVKSNCDAECDCDDTTEKPDCTNTCGLMSCCDKKKLDSLKQIEVDKALSATSTNPVQNQAIYAKIQELNNLINGTLKQPFTSTSTDFNTYKTRGLYHFGYGTNYTHTPIGTSPKVAGDLTVYTTAGTHIQQDFNMHNGYKYTRTATQENGTWTWDNWYLTHMPMKKVAMTLESGCTGLYGYEGAYGYQFFWEQKKWIPNKTLYGWKKLASFSSNIDINGFDNNNDNDITGFLIGDHIGNSDVMVQRNGIFARAGTTVKVVDWNFSWFVPRKDFGKQPY